MKKIVTVTEVPANEFGLESLMGEQVILFCMNYFYAGKLEGVNERFVLLEDAAIVYETGAFSDANWKDAQKIGQPLYILIDKIEAFARGK
jgi:hypothetical protein